MGLNVSNYIIIAMDLSYSNSWLKKITKIGFKWNSSELDIKSHILQPIDKAQISKKRLHIKRIRITKIFFVQISKKIWIKN